MPFLDTRVPAVLLRIDRNPFHHGTLGAVRSLGRAGVEVHVVADSTGSPVRRSRFVSEMHPPPPPGASAGEIVAALRRVAARVSRPAVLIPMDDASAVAVAQCREHLAPSYLLPQQPGALAELVADKAELAALCASAGIPHPVTLIPDSPAQAAAAAWQLGLPVVAKWSRPWLVPTGTGLRSTVVVHSAQEAQALYLRAEEAGSRLLLQAYLPPGPDRDWFFHGYVDRSGAVCGGGPGRKQRAWPRGAGLTAVGRWTPNPQLQSLVERLVGTLGYRGVFDLDFRRDGASGRYHLLDFNPRPGAQFRLFADGAGLDVVRALHLDLTHRPLPAPAPLPGRAFVVENYAPLSALRPQASGCELAWHARDDLAPGLTMWALWCRHVFRRLLDRVRRSAPVAAQPRVVRQPGEPNPLTDDEKASSC
ncbi:ATP-grasp domain-containing protein [Streptomyces sp. NBC_00620]|uniref:carboxylate--amine ligase n=1 Tax=unclassified Streptomyces TaxID=2593676 RepID=UPI00224D1D9E|nr:ATP-grasp domain-containing protein [Streptomyces sp. NBC_00620]MCX4974377.1 ATP-grasp domain-containing protein [Streptomyces sp. NBC_00620]WUC11352.1 ATP-grasp domain-containing protein [Streptomyces sp. NBC_00564]